MCPAFSADGQKQQQWTAFLGNVSADPGTLAEVTASIAAFLMPHAIAAAKLGRDD